MQWLMQGRFNQRAAWWQSVAENAVVDVGKDVMATLKRGEPFGTDVATGKGFVDRGEIPQRHLNLSAGVSSGFFFIEHLCPV